MNQEQRKTGGFFSKMLQKVRGIPAGDAPDLALRDREGPYSKEALNHMVERKRHNDAIRAQEFAELRQLRSGRAAAGRPAPARASGFLPSMLEVDTRVHSTLQKINAIEAQMAQQWWRTPAGAGVAGAAAPVSPVTPVTPMVAVAAATAVEQPMPVDATLAEPWGAEAHTSAPMPHGLSAAQWRAIPTLGEESMVAAPAPAAVDFWVSPELEEVAILFAHGEVTAAKTRLLELLVQELDRQPAVDDVAVAGIWHAALDLYRALGDEEGFEPLAIDYAAHFGRSAPLWFSMPAQWGALPGDHGATAQTVMPQGFRWHAPAVLRPEDMRALEAVQQTVPVVAHLEWTLLEQMDAAAVPLLTLLLEQWASQPGHFAVAGVERLLAVLEDQAPVGDAARPAHGWALRSAALRWLNRPQAFEQVALDYCVTYEVSPPSWVAPLCLCEEVVVGAFDTASAWPLSHAGGPHSQLAPASVVAQALPASVLAVGASPQEGDAELPGLSGLSGVLEGDAAPWLQALQARAQRGVPLEIPCDGLIRVDFVAAGMLLNWVADMQAQGYQLRFTQLHQLVAVFFQVIGIQEHAVLQARTA